MRTRSRCTLVIALLLTAAGGTARTAAQPDPHASELFERAFSRAAALPRLQAIVIAHRGAIVAERRFHGPSLDTPVNIKSVSKSVIATLVGIAIDRGELAGPDQPIAPFFPAYVTASSDPRLRTITIGQLLSMQSGLTRTSGPSYGAWINSRDWVGYILRAPLLVDPGGPMIYSTGNTHLLSAILTRATHRSTYQYALERLAKPLGVRLERWARDPQGIFLGGNEMRLSAHALVRFGELYRNGGQVGDRRIVSESWIRNCWTARATSIFSGEPYGYGWFVSELAGHPLYYAWGYGGQFVFVLPALDMTVVTTSNPNGARDFEHLGEIYALLRDCIIPALDPTQPAADSC